MKNDYRKIVCDQTVAFPEGGGQIGDSGFIICADGEVVPFIDTKKGVGTILHLNNRHSIQINTPVYHVLGSAASELIPGMRVRINIDVIHRIKTTALHSALHIALMAVIQIRSNLEQCIKGCHIDTEKARMDFFCDKKFTQEEMLSINMNAQSLIKEDIKVKRYLFQNQKEAWIWRCKDFECPCGGTHVLSTGQLGDISIRRKNIGKTTERIIVELNHLKIEEGMYH